MSDILPKNAIASILSRNDPLCLLFAVFHACLETAYGVAAVFDHPTINQDPNFDAHLCSRKVETITSRQNIFRPCGRNAQIVDLSKI